MPDYRHRIETTEAADSYVSPQESSAGMLVAVGTAPVHMAKDPSAAFVPHPVPKLFHSFLLFLVSVSWLVFLSGFFPASSSFT